MAGESGFGAPVLPGTPEAFTAALIAVSLHIALPLPHPELMRSCATPEHPAPDFGAF